MSDNEIIQPPLLLVEREGDAFKMALGTTDVPTLLLVHKYLEMEINGIMLRNMAKERQNIIQATSIVDRIRKGISPNGR